MLFEVSNRGGKAILGMFGDDFLMEQGYTLVWLGWEFDVPPGPSALRLYAPVAEGITGLVRSEITPDHKETRWSLGDRSALAYPVLRPDDPARDAHRAGAWRQPAACPAARRLAH